jgi:hypothetical protein
MELLTVDDSQDIYSQLAQCSKEQLIELVTKLNDYIRLNQYNKERMVELLMSIVDIHYVNFRQTAIYSKLSNITQTFSYSEQDLLEEEIRSCFKDFIRNLSYFYPKITRKEILICCLSFHFPMKTIGLCLGYESTESVRQHKCRIKKKMTDKGSSFLFDFIFQHTSFQP